MIKILAILAFFYANLANAENEFRHFFNSFETLSADFIQQTYDENNKLLASTTGYLRFERPEKFIWQTQTPIEQTLLLANNELWLIDTELEQASRRTLSELNNTPLYWLINRPEKLEKLPQYTPNAQTGQKKTAIRWYQTHGDNQLSFGFQHQQLIAIKLTNPLQQKVLVIFKTLKINPNFAPNTFELNLGEEFDIIG
jgi:outer membrane lipoprotein-sorting protein